jgi:cytochrome P450
MSLLLSIIIHTLLITIALIVLYTIYIIRRYKQQCYKYRHLPGLELFLPLEILYVLNKRFPRVVKYFHPHVPLELFTQFRQFVNEVHQYNFKKYGPVYKVIQVHRSFVFLDGDESLQLKKMMTLQGYKLAEKTDAMNARISQLFGPNIFSTNVHDTWKRMKTIIQPAFTDQHLIHTVPSATVQVVHELINSIEQAPKNRDICSDMSSVSLDILGHAGFGVNFDSVKQQTSDIHQPDELVKATFNIISNMALYFILPFDFMREIRLGKIKVALEARDYFVKRISQLINERKNHPSDDKDILSLLIHGRESVENTHSFKPLSDKELTANTFVAIIAGHETSSRCVSFALFCLAKNPAIQRKAQELIDERLPNCQTPTMEDYEALTYIQHITLETLRLHPVAVSLFRKAQKTFSINNYTIPKGTIVVINNHFIYRDEKYFKDPDTFNPDRFEEQNDSIPRLALTPFGFGLRACIGKRFAEIEIGFILIMLLQRYNVTVDPKYELRTEVMLTSQPIDPLYISFERRDTTNH